MASRASTLAQFGTHGWVPEVQRDFSAGMFRDVARDAIPANGCYDAADYLFDRPGVLYKRGGSSYQGAGAIASLFGTVTYMNAVAEAYFPSPTAGTATQVCAVTDLGDFVSNVFLGLLSGFAQGPTTRDKPKLFVGASKNLLVVTDASGAKIPYVYDGASSYRPLGGTSTILTVTGTPTSGSITVTATEVISNSVGVDSAVIVYNSTNTQAKTALDAMSQITGVFTVTGGALPGTPLVITSDVAGTALGLKSTYNSLAGGTAPAAAFTWNTTATNCPTAIYSTIHLARIVLANTPANPNRIWFSPIPDPAAAWDSTSYVDADHPITGLAVVNGNLLVFSRRYLEKFVGDTPPPGTNFTHLTVDAVGCSDARSITVSNGFCYFANYNGVYRTDGVTVQSVTDGKIGFYWRSTIASGGASIISTSMYARRFLVVQVLASNRTLVLGLIFDTVTGSWGRITGNASTMLTSAAQSSTDQVYGASGSSARIFKLAGFWSPTNSNKNDADGTAVTCVLEPRSPGSGDPSLKAFGKARVTYDMTDAASDNPTLAVTVAAGIEATTFAAVAESPLAETTDATRARFSTGKRSQALTHRFTQTNASAKTEIYAVEQDVRPFGRSAGGQ